MTPLSILLLLFLKLISCPQHPVLPSPSVYKTGWNLALTISMYHQYFFVFKQTSWNWKDWWTAGMIYMFPAVLYMPLMFFNLF
jgi:hypothetical protein